MQTLVKMTTTAFSILLMTGCLNNAMAAAKIATPEQERYAKQAVPPSGKALIYVYRLEDAGAHLMPGLWLNKRASGTLSQNTFGMWAASTGRVEVRAGSESSEPLTISCDAGRVYFIQLTVGKDGDTALQAVPYGTGRTELRDARLVLDPALTPRQSTTAQKPANQKASPAAKHTTPNKPVMAAPRPTDHEGEVGTGRSGAVLSIKGGSFTLGSTPQIIRAETSPGVMTDFQTTFGATSQGYGVEVEWRQDNGWSFGGEALVHAHEYTTVSTLPSGSGDMHVTAVLINTKKYFRVQDTFQPYVGAGIGVASVRLSGQIEGTTTGYSLQAMGGAAMRWRHIGIFTEARYLATNTADVEASGFGLFAGVSAHF